MALLQLLVIVHPVPMVLAQHGNQIHSLSAHQNQYAMFHRAMVVPIGIAQLNSWLRTRFIIMDGIITTTCHTIIITTRIKNIMDMDTVMVTGMIMDTVMDTVTVTIMVTVMVTVIATVTLITGKKPNGSVS
jgi:hypothetical protein